MIEIKMPLERIYIPEAKLLLSVRSNESVVKWCQDNNVKVYSERNRKFMCRIEFLAALEKPIIESLKRKYGDKWKEVYEIMISNEPADLFEYQEKKIESKMAPLARLKRYKPISDFARNFVRNIIQDED